MEIMGNTIEVKLKEEKLVLEVTETQRADFKEYIIMADHSMAALAKSLDALKVACELLLRQLDKDHQSQDSTIGTDREKVNNQESVCRLLEMIDGSVSDNKYIVMNSLSKLLNFVWDVGKPCFDNAENSPLEFLIDKYKADRNCVGREDEVSFTDLRIRSLQREIKMLHEKITASERELTILKTREVSYRKEIEILEKENTAQKEKIVDLTEKQNSEFEHFVWIARKSGGSMEMNHSSKQKHEQLKQEKMAAICAEEIHLNRKEEQIANGIDQDLEQELSSLKSEIPSTKGKEAPTEDLEILFKEMTLREETDSLNQESKAMTTKKLLYGYEYVGQSVLTRFKQRIKEDLYTKLKMELASCNVYFEISSCSSSHSDGTQTNKVIIVPMFKVSSYDVLNSKIQSALKETNAGINLVILHFCDDNSQAIDCKTINKFVPENVSEIGGYFEFNHFNLNQRNTEMNNKNCTELLHFLKSKCMKGSSLKDEAASSDELNGT